MNSRRPFLISGRDIGEQRRRDLFGDEILERPGIEETLAGAADLENVRGGGLRVERLQGGVVTRAGKREWRHQRARAHAGDDGIIRPLAAGAQAVEQSGAERTVRAAGRKNEPRSRLRRQRLVEVGFGIAPEARIRHAGNDGGCGIGGGIGNARRQLRQLRGRGRRRARRLRRLRGRGMLGAFRLRRGSCERQFARRQ